MNELSMYEAAYKGSKRLSLQDIPAAKATGFGAAADDYMERGIDLNEQLIRNKTATHFFRMTGDAMSGAGISKDDILIVDRSLTAVSGKIVIVAFEGELLVRRLQKVGDTFTLMAENKNFAPIVVTRQSSYRVWGVVTYVIHIV